MMGSKPSGFNWRHKKLKSFTEGTKGLNNSAEGHGLGLTEGTKSSKALYNANSRVSNKSRQLGRAKAKKRQKKEKQHPSWQISPRKAERMTTQVLKATLTIVGGQISCVSWGKPNEISPRKGWSHRWKSRGEPNGLKKGKKRQKEKQTPSWQISPRRVMTRIVVDGGIK